MAFWGAPSRRLTAAISGPSAVRQGASSIIQAAAQGRPGEGGPRPGCSTEWGTDKGRGQRLPAPSAAGVPFFPPCFFLPRPLPHPVSHPCTGPPRPPSCDALAASGQEGAPSDPPSLPPRRAGVETGPGLMLRGLSSLSGSFCLIPTSTHGLSNPPAPVICEVAGSGQRPSLGHHCVPLLSTQHMPQACDPEGAVRGPQFAEH